MKGPLPLIPGKCTLPVDLKNKPMASKIFLGLFFLALSSLSAFGQKLKSDGWEISIENYEVTKMELFGKTQTIHSGILKVKDSEGKTTEYRYYFPEANGKLSHLTIRDMRDNVLEPRLYYKEEDHTFTCHQGTEKETTEEAAKHKNVKDLILSGMLIWLKQKA